MWGVSINTFSNISLWNRLRCEFRAKRNSYSFHPGQCIVRGSQRKTYSCHCTTPEARYPWGYLYRLGRIYSTYSKQKKTSLVARKTHVSQSHCHYPHKLLPSSTSAASVDNQHITPIRLCPASRYSLHTTQRISTMSHSRALAENTDTWPWTQQKDMSVFF